MLEAPVKRTIGSIVPGRRFVNCNSRTARGCDYSIRALARKIAAALPALCCGLAALALAPQAAGSDGAGDPEAPPTLSKQELSPWVRQFPAAGAQLQDIGLSKEVQADQELRPFSGQTIVGLGISGSVRLSSNDSVVRVVLVDDQAHEYLVYETYPLLAPSSDFRIDNVCRETCLLPAIVPSVLKIELVHASLDIQTVVVNRTTAGPAVTPQGAAAAQLRVQEVKDSQEAEVVETLNEHIKARGLKWVAGETTISRLSYAEKKILTCTKTGRGSGPNLQGAEYYKGGIFEVPSGDETATAPGSEASTIVDSFDWRSRHGANRPGSPYYDGDTSGSGWLTSVKRQLCSDCWAHSALGATEAQANLYFNQHVDVDLSEQELVSCSGAGSCQSGGSTGSALAYVVNIGVVNEACFPESGTDEKCNVCPVPQDRIRIADFEEVNPITDDNLKQRLIKYGPLPFGIRSWWHAMVLAGYQKDQTTGETVWILKNSWGPDWGEKGYGYLKVSIFDIYLTYDLWSPVSSLLNSYTVACRDADGDGYYNWGISAVPPISCGNVPPTEDCDDSDPKVALMTEDGRCVAAPPIDRTPPVITVHADPRTLWPPNGKRVPVEISGKISDSGSGVDLSTPTYAVKDEYGQIHLTGHLALTSHGRYFARVLLEASRRKHDKDGRHYTITVSAKDKAGNVGSASTAVIVSHDMRKKD